ncbi:MAG TPA: hypothetical protein DCX53_04515 [Anaerolineae bacterium]|nr:hypothetical protein [Anaerolineae bacterium]
MKRTLITIAVTTLVVVTLLGVAASAIFGSIGMGASAPYDNRSFAEPAFAPAAPEPAAEFYLEESGGYDLAYDQSVVTSNVAATERLVIQNVDMSIVVVDPKSRMKEISDLAVEMGGFVVSSNLYQNTYGPNSIEVPEASMTIRVPSERLDEALEKVKEGAVDVTYENRSGEDVTNQYVDLQSRLKAKQDAEQKLLEIMDDAVDAEDVLAIYIQVQNIQTEIEVLKGQIKYYEESAALSAIIIRLVAEETVKPIEIGGWKLQGTANDAIQDLIRFTQGFTQFLIRFVLSFLPALILVAIPTYFVFIGGRALFRRFRKSKAVVEVKEEEK